MPPLNNARFPPFGCLTDENHRVIFISFFQTKFKVMDSKTVTVRVTKVEDVTKSKSSLQVGLVLTVLLNSNNNAILWIDPVNDQDWVFWVNSTCDIIK